MSIDVLQAKIRKTKNPSMICIAPSVLELPMPIKDAARAQYGDTLRAAAESYRQFSFGILDALKDVVPAVSIVSGAFAALGSDGVAAMEDVLARARELGFYVLLDLMRADVALNAEAMARACFGGIQVGEKTFTPYACDGVLMTGYLGSDSVKPFTQYCKDGKNVFIIARSSNKSAREVQDLLSIRSWPTLPCAGASISSAKTAIPRSASPPPRRTPRCCARSAKNMIACSSSFPATARRAAMPGTCSMPLTSSVTGPPSWPAAACSMPGSGRTTARTTISNTPERPR